MAGIPGEVAWLTGGGAGRRPVGTDIAGGGGVAGSGIGAGWLAITAGWATGAPVTGGIAGGAGDGWGLAAAIGRVVGGGIVARVIGAAGAGEAEKPGRGPAGIAAGAGSPERWTLMAAGWTLGCETGICVVGDWAAPGLIAGAGAWAGAPKTGLGRLGAGNRSSTGLVGFSLAGEIGLAGVMTGGGSGASLAGCWTGGAGAGAACWTCSRWRPIGWSSLGIWKIGDWTSRGPDRELSGTCREIFDG